ncbi:hypothetical protein N0V86_003305 [Didymella sp. IMI 355093]|nr:hypothetical protein N0V86_003305 [Didymella sp. IMI 355093]
MGDIVADALDLTPEPSLYPPIFDPANGDPVAEEAAIEARRAILESFGHRFRRPLGFTSAVGSNGDIVRDILLAYKLKLESLNLQGKTSKCANRKADGLGFHFHGKLLDYIMLKLDATSFYGTLFNFQDRLREVCSEILIDGSEIARVTLLEHEDMMAILNARGTALLNPIFVGHSEAINIVALAMLAAELYHGKVPCVSPRVGA